jgi:NitT/TauT family transport system permease protein
MRTAEELAGLDALETIDVKHEPVIRRLWSATWPKLAAIALALFLWQCVVWSNWKPEYLLPGPGKVFPELWEQIQNGTVWKAVRLTMERALKGYAVALVIGVIVGSLVARVRFLRSAFGSLITGLQTMPSIVWFPFAVILFQLSDSAITFVVVLGAAPAIANGLIAGADQIPPILLRAGRVLGARGLRSYWHIVLPASLPSFVGGLKQGWAFAWRSLMAGELLVTIAGKPSIGALMTNARSLRDMAGLMAWMIVILVIGVAVDSAVFGTLDRSIRHRWGLVDAATA